MHKALTRLRLAHGLARYQAMATNFLVLKGLVGKKSGSTTRASVDAVVTQVSARAAAASVHEAHKWMPPH